MKERLSVHERAAYLGDAVFAASDGIITTFAIVAGSAGASFGSGVVLALGFANLLADSFSMATGHFMGVKSEIEYEESKGQDGDREGPPLRHALVTFVSFNLAGLMPLAPFVLRLENPFYFSILFVIVAMFLVGYLKALYVRRSFLRSGLEMLAIGGFAALVAYGVGFVVDRFVLSS